MTPPPGSPAMKGMSAEEKHRLMALEKEVQQISPEQEAAIRADERVKAWNEAIEKGMEKVKRDCPMCQGMGYEENLKGEAIGCEYCGRPHNSLRELKLPEAQPVEPSEGEGTHGKT